MNPPVLITYSNNGYAPFAINLLMSLVKNCTKHLLHFYCLDEEIYSTLTKNFGHYEMFKFQLVNGNVSKNFESYGTPNYNAITHTKLYLLRDALERYKFIHFIDCDIVCVNEPPLDFYESYAKYDIVFQYDTGTMYENGPLHPLFNPWVCTGNTTLRDSEGTRYILDQIEKMQLSNGGNDQECLYKYFKEVSGLTDVRMEKKASLYVYPIELYTNGYMINNDRMTTKNTYFFHANHVSGGVEKVRLLKKIGQWYLEEA